MAIFKRGRTYWFHFWWNGEHIQRSTRQGNPRVARQMEAAHKTALAKGEVGLVERKPAPTLREFEKRFMDSVKTRCAEKPETVRFYQAKMTRLLEFTPMADTRLDRIDEGMIESFVQHRRKTVSPASVNRELATLRRALRLAHEWKVIDRVPRIRLLPGERNREFVLTHAQERNYLEFAPQPLRDAAILMLDTGLRVGEVLALEWHHVHLDPVGSARIGYIHVRSGKTENAKRNVGLTARVRKMLEAGKAKAKSSYVFTNEAGDGPLSIYTLEAIHSFRHTFGTRLGEAGADAFTIMRVMGHSTVIVSQKYVHPTPEAVERAFERLDAMNQKAVAKLSEGSKRQLPATIPATVTEASEGAIDQVL
jgi:integrase